MQSGYIHLTEYQSGQLLNTHEKKHDCLTAVLQKWRFSASYDNEVVNQNLVLRLKYSGENRHLRKAAKRCGEIRCAPFATSCRRLTPPDALQSLR